jgi:hypothetical protein
MLISEMPSDPANRTGESYWSQLKYISIFSRESGRPRSFFIYFETCWWYMGLMRSLASAWMFIVGPVGLLSVQSL